MAVRSEAGILEVVGTVAFRLSSGEICVIDSCDEDLLRHSWRTDGSGYVRADFSKNTTPPYIMLHAVIFARVFGAKAPGITVDHRNLNKLDNRRDNLRPATAAQQQHNTAKRFGAVPFKGVGYKKLYNYYTARITVPGGQGRRLLGRFRTAEAAAYAYDRAARQYFGEFARPNFAAPPDDAWLETQRVPAHSCHPHPKLSDNDGRAIYARLLMGDGPLALARMFNVDKKTVANIRNHVGRWAFLEELNRAG